MRSHSYPSLASRVAVPAALVLLLCGCAIWSPPAGAQQSTGPAAQPEMILKELAAKYLPEAPESLSLVVEFRFSRADDAAQGTSPPAAEPPEMDVWHLIVEPGPQIAIHKGPNKRAAFLFTMSPETLEKIFAGQMTAATAVAKASGRDTAPLEFEATAEAVRLKNMRDTMMEFVQHYFNPTTPEVTHLSEAHSRVIHGASVVPLFYATGMRSAWYTLKKGQQLNEPGDQNPYPQAFIFISGRGKAKIGELTIDVEAGEAYYIPPDADHVVWTERDEPLVLIWLAWGEGA